VAFPFLTRKIILSLVLAFGTLSCSVNILSEFADTTSDEAIYFAAKDLISQRNYDGALAKFALLSPAYAARRDVLLQWATAYGGNCGIETVPLIQALSTLGTAPTARLFEWLLDYFSASVVTATTQLAACISAESTIKLIGASGSSRDDDENLFMVLISFAKMGKLMAIYADSVDSDGTVDPAFDPCATPAVGVANSKELATGFFNAYDSLSSLTSVTIGGGQLTNLVTSIDGFCGGAPPIDICPVTAQLSIAGVTNADEKALKTMVAENSFVGLGVTTAVGACPGDYANCNCP
jgi:hypothetical protein